MKIEKIKKLLKSEDYDFLRMNEHLGNNIILLGLGGSHAYGTDTENSDLDIRGCALNKKEEILISTHNFEQVTEETTDTTIYSFNKLITLLSNCNPNTIELIGLKPEHYLYIHPIGQELLDNDQIRLRNALVRALERDVQIIMTNVNHHEVKALYEGIDGFILDEVTRYSGISGTNDGRKPYSELIVSANIRRN